MGYMRAADTLRVAYEAHGTRRVEMGELARHLRSRVADQAEKARTAERATDG